MSIRIISASYPVTLQDAGRPGFRAYGVPLSGPMDPVSFRLANLLCGNAPGEAALEITLHGLIMLFEEDSLIALCGGGSLPMIDGDPVGSFRPLFVRQGTLMRFSYSSTGCRMYMAMAGGFRSGKIMGSAATYVPAGIGGLEGRNVRKGDLLMRKDSPGLLSKRIADSINHSSQPVHQGSWGSNPFSHQRDDTCLLRFLPGPEWELFSNSSRHLFQTETFQLSDRADRMGYQLRGPVLKCLSSTEMLSTAVSLGSVQVTHAGVPIILMADGQTTGGYPRIVQIITADMALCGQLRPGSDLRFIRVSEREALDLYRLQMQHLASVGRAIRIRHGL